MKSILFIVIVLLIIFIYYNKKVDKVDKVDIVNEFNYPKNITIPNIEKKEIIFTKKKIQKICDKIVNTKLIVLNTNDKIINNDRYLILNVHDITNDMPRILQIKYRIIDDGIKIEDVNYINNMNIIGHSFKSASADEKGLLSLLEPTAPVFSESVPGWNDNFIMVVGDNNPCIQWSEFRNKDIIPKSDYYIPNRYKIYNESTNSIFSLFRENLGISNGKF